MKIPDALPLVLIGCTLLALACGEEAPAPDAKPAAAARPAPVASQAGAQAPEVRPLAAAGTYALQFEGGALSVDAFLAPRRPLLEELASKAGFVLEAAPGEWPLLTLRIDAQPLELALPLLVGEFEYRAEWDSAEGAHRLAKLVVGAPRASGDLAAGSLRAGEVSASLERALKSYRDGERLSEEEALASLDAEDPEQRVRALLALEPEGEGLDALVRAIESDPDPRVRAAATVGLEEGEDFAALQALVGALDDPEPEVVIEVLDSLEFAGDESLAPKIEPLLAHPDARVRQAAGNAMQMLGN